MATLFKAIAILVALAILVPMNVFIILHYHSEVPWFVVPINIYALACLVPNSVLVVRPKVLICYIMLISLTAIGFLLVGIVEESEVMWDAFLFNGLAALVMMSPVVSVSLSRVKLRAEG